MGGWMLGLFALGLSALALGATDGGLCTQEPAGSGLPAAVCHFPSCPVGADCMPPTVEKESATIQFHEPFIRWQDRCPDAHIMGACWEVRIDFRFRMAASDPSGVSHIGMNLMDEISTRRNFKLHWGKAETKDALGRYEASGVMTVYVPPGQRLELGVFELCARDGRQNEGCTLPAKGRSLGWRMGE